MENNKKQHAIYLLQSYSCPIQCTIGLAIQLYEVYVNMAYDYILGLKKNCRLKIRQCRDIYCVQPFLGYNFN